MSRIPEADPDDSTGMNLLKRATLVTLVAGSGLIFATAGASAATTAITPDAVTDMNGQSGFQGEEQVGQSGDQGAKQNEQTGDQGAKANDQSGDQGTSGDGRNEQSGDQGQSGHNGV